MSEILKQVIDALRGGIAKYHPATGRFVFQYYSDAMATLLAGDPAAFERAVEENALEIVCECDRAQVEASLCAAMEHGTGLNACFRTREQNGALGWCQLNGWSDGEAYFVLFSGMSPEIQLFQSIAGESADDIYVIEKGSYQLLYANDLKAQSAKSGQTSDAACYQILHGNSAPCAFCDLNGRMAGNLETTYEHNGRYFTTRSRETSWNGIPAYVKYVRDITEEVASRKERERLEQYFQTVVKYLPGGMAVIHHDVDGSIKPEYLSEGFSEMFSMSPEESWTMYQGDALSGVHPEDRAYVKERLEQCIQEKREKYELQYRLKGGGGDYIWVNAKFSVVQGISGDVRVYVTYHDITAERKMQEQLRQQYQEQIHQHYMMAGPDALILGHCNITRNTISEVVDHTNSALLETFGTDRDGFFRGIGTLIENEEERELFYSRFLNQPTKAAYEAGTQELVLPCFLHLPGQKTGKYVQFKVVLLEMPDTGDLMGILTVTDITEKTIREKILLQLSSTNYDLVANVDLFSDTYEILIGGDDNIPEKKGRHTARIKKIIQQTLSDSEQEMKYASNMLDPAQILERLKRENSYSFVYSQHNAAGEIQIKKMIVSAIDLRLGRICLVRADVTDVLKAERKAKEELEHALDEARKASRVKSDFLSSMSHDIRTPMNAIVGMTTLARSNLGNTEKLQDYLNKISISSQHLLSLINDILDMSQIEQSKIHLNPQPVLISELISRISSIMTSQAENAGLRFQIESGSFQHPKFSGDPLRINQILINLLSNAVKFTPEGGAVLFRTDEVPACGDRHVRYRFTVQDSGIGMSEAFLDQLFKPFIRSDSVSRIEGTGLGLSITKGLVDLMGGTIQVESRVQHGTRFEVELEFDCLEPAEPSPEGECAGRPDNCDLSGYHFLLVEDNEINSEILGELLQMRGATFTVKTNGLQAVHAFEQSPPGTYDAIFMDIQMPVMNGYEATKAIRALDRPDAGTIVILAMTANAFVEDVRAAREAGMDGHIAKPIDLKLLYDTITKLLKRKPAPSDPPSPA